MYRSWIRCLCMALPSNVVNIVNPLTTLNIVCVRSKNAPVCIEASTQTGGGGLTYRTSGNDETSNHSYSFLDDVSNSFVLTACRRARERQRAKISRLMTSHLPHAFWPRCVGFVWQHRLYSTRYSRSTLHPTCDSFTMGVFTEVCESSSNAKQRQWQTDFGSRPALGSWRTCSRSLVLIDSYADHGEYG